MYRQGSMENIETFKEVISLWPTKSAFAKDIGEDYGKVHQWDRRNSIPSDKWHDVEKAAKKRGFKKITVEYLQKLKSIKKQ